MHCGNNVSGTRAKPKYLLPFLSLFFMGNQNPATTCVTYDDICDTPSTTCVHVKLLHHLWILVVVVEAAEHGGPPLQQGDLPALPGHGGAACWHPSGNRNSFKEMMNIMYNFYHFQAFYGGCQEKQSLQLWPVSIWMEYFCGVEVFIRISSTDDHSQFVVLQLDSGARMEISTIEHIRYLVGNSRVVCNFLVPGLYLPWLLKIPWFMG